MGFKQIVRFVNLEGNEVYIDASEVIGLRTINGAQFTAMMQQSPFKDDGKVYPDHVSIELRADGNSRPTGIRVRGTATEVYSQIEKAFAPDPAPAGDGRPPSTYRLARLILNWRNERKNGVYQEPTPQYIYLNPSLIISVEDRGNHSSLRFVGQQGNVLVTMTAADTWAEINRAIAGAPPEDTPLTVQEPAAL